MQFICSELLYTWGRSSLGMSIFPFTPPHHIVFPSCSPSVQCTLQCTVQIRSYCTHAPNHCTPVLYTCLAMPVILSQTQRWCSSPQTILSQPAVTGREVPGDPEGTPVTHGVREGGGMREDQITPPPSLLPPSLPRRAAHSSTGPPVGC